jgi:hypothetical protein
MGSGSILQKKATPMALRYQSDYSRWEEWRPDDPATLAEQEQAEEEKQKVQDEAFENANADFCNQVSAQLACPECAPG